jgi:hypothetical protein
METVPATGSLLVILIAALLAPSVVGLKRTPTLCPAVGANWKGTAGGEGKLKGGLGLEMPVTKSVAVPVLRTVSA